MSLSAEHIARSLAALARIEPGFARAIERAGLPAPRFASRGYASLLRFIVGQQLSVAAARAIFARLEQLLGVVEEPAHLLGRSDEQLRGIGFSRQKILHARSLAALVAEGRLDLERLPADDEAAIAELVRIKGVGRWTAEVYLLIAEGRPDIWPAGDLGVRIGAGMIMGQAGRPDEQAVRRLAEDWRPHRSAAALMAWHCYSSGVL